MTPGLTILIPHYSRPVTDRALEVMLRILRENTVNPTREIVVAEQGDPYKMWNRYTRAALYEHVVFLNNDMMVAPGWDVAMQKHAGDGKIVMNYLVEPGVVSVDGRNIPKDFGRLPDAFRRAEFEAFAKDREKDLPEVMEGMGWYMPCLFTKSYFLEMGGYPTAMAFPHHNDVLFWQHCASRGARFVKARSFTYHLQGLSNPEHEPQTGRRRDLTSDSY